MPPKGKAAAPNDTSDREIVSTRLFAAPRALVFKMWTEPEHLVQWWGPKGFTNTFHEFDLRPGGLWRFIMHGPDGKDYPNESLFEEIVTPERIVFQHVSRPVFKTTVVFEELAGQTKITWRMLFETAAEYDAVKGYVVPGNEQNLDKLEAHLATLSKHNAPPLLSFPSDRETVITRMFDAPRALVFAAMTQPEHVRRWYGPRALTFVSCEIDLHVGGRWRYVLRAPDGSELAFSGEYREIVPHERIVTTEGYEAMPGHDYLSTIRLDEHDGQTTFTNTLVYQTTEDREGHLASGMEPGMVETFERFDEHLATLAMMDGAATPAGALSS